jgi:hypothetical protein
MGKNKNFFTVFLTKSYGNQWAKKGTEFRIKRDRWGNYRGACFFAPRPKPAAIITNQLLTNRGGAGIIKYTLKIELPNRIEGILVLPLLLYRWIWYGYGFRRIRLGGGKFALVDAEDYYHLAMYRWRAVRDGQQFYATRSFRTKDGKKRKILMHRQIMKVRWDVLVDHVNRNGLDNRRANLRPATASQNARNRSKISSRKTVSRFKGIAACVGRRGWQARIRVDGKLRFLGYYYDEVEAAKAYDRAARKYHGEFAALNIPDAGPHRGWRLAVAVAVILFILLLWRGLAEMGGISISPSEAS